MNRLTKQNNQQRTRIESLESIIIYLKPGAFDEALNELRKIKGEALDEFRGAKEAQQQILAEIGEAKKRVNDGVAYVEGVKNTLKFQYAPPLAPTTAAGVAALVGGDPTRWQQVGKAGLKTFHYENYYSAREVNLEGPPEYLGTLLHTRTGKISPGEKVSKPSCHETGYFTFICKS